MYKSEVYGYSNIFAKVVAHSVTENGSEMITLQTRAPKFLDAEIEKHRMLSSNSSSDRAIPFNKMKERDIFIPEDVRYNEKGMQGSEYVCGDKLDEFKEDLEGMYKTLCVSLNHYQDIHKQHLNRYLLGFSLQDKVITGNKEQFEYFFSLRSEEGADPAVQELSRCMEEALKLSEPTLLQEGEWHLPYVDLMCPDTGQTSQNNESLEELLKCSVARCARVSYSNHDNSEPSVDEDLALYDMLLQSKHLSCFEHQAIPMTLYNEAFPAGAKLDFHKWEYGGIGGWAVGTTHMDKRGELWSGNFKAWAQYRQIL